MKICKVEGCKGKYHGKGYCSKHYHRYERYGDPLLMKIERHGLCGTPEYYIWATMKERCYNKNYHKYNRYGARGITVCGRWRNSFIAFYDDTGKRPFPKAQIDRRDNDGNYEPDNCRWATGTENIRNSSCPKLTIEKARKIRFLGLQGKAAKSIALLFDVSTATIWKILNNKSWKEIEV